MSDEGVILTPGCIGLVSGTTIHELCGTRTFKNDPVHRQSLSNVAYNVGSPRLEYFQ